MVSRVIKSDKCCENYYTVLAPGVFQKIVVFLSVFFRKFAKCNSPGENTVLEYYGPFFDV